jgi:hypothetical protein
MSSKSSVKIVQEAQRGEQNCPHTGHLLGGGGSKVSFSFAVRSPIYRFFGKGADPNHATAKRPGTLPFISESFE